MDIKRIPSLQPYQVTAGTDANDEERRREQQRERAPKRKELDAKSSPALAEPITSEAPESNELCRQIVDSEKLLQLMELRPIRTATQKQKLLRLQSSQRVSAQHKDKKHVNRSL